MSNLNKNFETILNDLEQSISDEKTLEIVKVQMFNLYNMFFEELENQNALNNKKMMAILNTEQEILDKVSNLEDGLKGIEQDIYGEDDDVFEILCPYCNNKFEVDCCSDEVTCPECNNKIELDWDHNCDCGCDDCDDECNCDDCHHHDED